MRKNIFFQILLTTALLTLVQNAWADKVQVSSPNGKITLSVENDNLLTYSIDYAGLTVISKSGLGFEFRGEAPMGEGLSLTDKQLFNGEQEQWTPVVRNKHDKVSMKWNRALISFREQKDEQRQLQLEVKVFDEGVAFRYHLYDGAGLVSREITRECTEFNVGKNAQAYIAEFPKRYTSSQEAEFFKKPVTAFTDSTLAALPLLIEQNAPDNNVYLAITEAFIDDYPGFYIGGANGNLATLLSPLPGEKEDGVKARFEDECTTPWRVIMIADNPGRFIESELIRTLNPPCGMTNTEWIKPGKSAWDHWWSGEVKMETSVIREYIDFAAEMGFPYMLIDWQWYGPYNEAKADITKPAPQLDWQGIIDHAKAKNVKLWLWIYCTDVNRNDAYKKAFELYEKWGIAGVKIDFMDRSDQYMVNWYRRIVAEAAKRHLMIDLHGAYKPDGIERTYPNFLTREGVMGNEYNKWNNGLTAEHNVKLAFTRMLAGPMDYTPGGFLNVKPQDYKAQSPTLIPNTRCAELAKFVIYDSPWTVVCDHPKNVIGQAGADFVKIVPTEWDDTHFLQGSPDSYIAMAKRNGNEWFIGVMNNSVARTIDLDMSFLPSSNYTLEFWKDGKKPSDAKHQTTVLKTGKALKIKMAENGGYVAVMKHLP